MEDSERFPGPAGTPTPSGAGTIKRIRLENFMCHSNLQIELGPRVNFITGQNGSTSLFTPFVSLAPLCGKSAILAAICVAFGSRAKGTQRAATLKDFIKNGCSHAAVEVEIKNEGHDAFKHDIYGDAIILERRINQSGGSMTLKDHRGRKVAGRKNDIQELIDHFNIDVENPCVVMSQDKSREFLHSGNKKDKFKFFFKATLLQQVNDTLQRNTEGLKSVSAAVDEDEASIKPVEKELEDLQRKIRNMKHLEEISQEIEVLTKKLAWALVYDVDKKKKEHIVMMDTLKQRVPACQRKIDEQLAKMESLKEKSSKKKGQIDCLIVKASEVKSKQKEFEESISMARKEKIELEEKHKRATNQIDDKEKQVSKLKRQIEEIKEQHLRNTQAEKSETEEKIRELKRTIDAATDSLSRLENEEFGSTDYRDKIEGETDEIAKQISDNERKQNVHRSAIIELQNNRRNKVTAFGGGKVLQLLRAIENHRHQFKRPPIGPIGANMALANDDRWALAVDCALGKLLNAFIVTNHSDSVLLKNCGREANYGHLRIYIYDFERPRLNIPPHLLPGTNHPTVLSVIHSSYDTLLNVLIDMGNAERQVLVKDYDTAKAVAFDQRMSNVHEVYTSDGYRMFCRESVQTVLPPNQWLSKRLCASFDDQIIDREQQVQVLAKEAEDLRQRKRDSEGSLHSLGETLRSAKKKRWDAERELASMKLELEDLERSTDSASMSLPTSTLDELHEEISKIEEEIKHKQTTVEKLQFEIGKAEAKFKALKISFQSLCDSAKEDFKTLDDAEIELTKIETDLKTAEMIENAEAKLRELEDERQERYRKASIICPESDLENLGGASDGLDSSSPEQLSAHLSIRKDRLHKESQQYVCVKALELRWKKFESNKNSARRDLTWKYDFPLA
ncbi:unnamed protein product [Linum tenue]|uniref:Rad50/SbcC-type AAA domain-containing protein n=1 Tax=Linum tenue TaxID=586396 RepID=A0AAV0H6H5_9ROSI|nr:unnamed protein product [Linum tenue]